MDECRACGATSNLEYFAPETCIFGDGSRLDRDALLCAACVDATTLRRVSVAPGVRQRLGKAAFRS